MPTTASYLSVAILLLGVVPTNLFGLISPLQIVHTPPFPLPQTRYGLYQACTKTSCRSFPDWEQDCRFDGGFCDGWWVARYLVVIATLISISVTIEALGAMCGGARRRNAAWRVIAPLLLIQGVCMGAGVVLVLYWKDHGGYFYIGKTEAGAGLVSVGVGSIVSLVCGVALFVRGCTHRAEYTPL